VKILVDTHIFLWAITDDHRLSAENRTVYLDNSNQLYLSVASVWEMLIKCGLGKLPLPKPASGYILKQMEKNRVEMLTIRAAHLTQLESLPPIHRDPFDRMMVAQASAEGMPIMSADPALRRYGVRVL
jgi:PIN domain nuclease of toxin-antitoxin system